MGSLTHRVAGRLRRKFLLRASAGLLLAKSTWFSATAVVPQLSAEWKLSAAGASGLTVAVQVGFVAGALASAGLLLPDRWRLQRLMGFACMGAALSNLILAWAPGPHSAVALRFATGAFIAGVYPPALKLAVTWFPGRQGTAFGVLVGALTFSSALPHLVNALGGLDWRAVVWATSASTVLGGWLLAGASSGPHAFPTARLRAAEVGAVLAEPAVRLAILGYLAHMWELYAMWTWFAIFYADALASQGVRAWPAAAYVGFGVIAVGGVGNVLGGIVGDRFGRARTAEWILSLSVLCAVAAGPMRHGPPVLLAVLGLVWGVLVVADSPLFSALVAEAADQAYVGTALTVQMAAGFGLTSISIGLVPYLHGLLGWDWAFASLAFGPLAGVVAMRRLRRVSVDVGTNGRQGRRAP